MAAHIDDPADADPVYAAIADPQEQPIDIDDAYDAILCTGDILNFAPEPGADVALEDSLLYDYNPDVTDLYAEQDLPGILEQVAAAGADDQVIERAADRYDRFFQDLDDPFYYVTGNQDIPAALETAADRYDRVRPADDLPGVGAVHGFVASFADLPETECFPGEISEDTFYDRLRAAEEHDTVVTHTLPDDRAIDAELVLASAGRGTPEQGNVVALPQHTTGAYRLFTP